MADLTAEQLTDFRADIGDASASPAFSDAELQRLYARAGTYTRAVLMAFEQLIANTAKFTDYTQNDTQEKKSQVFENLRKTRAIWAEKVAEETAEGTQKRQVGIAGLYVAPRTRSKPNA